MGMLLETKDCETLIKEDKGVIWEQSVYRDQVPLLSDVMMRGYVSPKNFQELVGVFDSWTSAKFINHDIYTSPVDKQRFNHSFDGYSAADIWSVTRACYTFGDTLIQEVRDCEKEDWSMKSDAELLLAVQNYLENIGKFCVFIVFPLYVFEKSYQKKIEDHLHDKKVTRLSEVMAVLTTPEKKNQHYYEQSGILTIGIRHRTQRNTETINQ